jgi:hypothetical protein
MFLHPSLFSGVISGLVLAFAAVDPNFNFKAGNPFSSSGLFFACTGLLVLGLGSYWSFRYTRIARQLQLAKAVFHLTKTEVMQVLWHGLVVNAVGMFLSLLGIEAIAAALLGKISDSSTRVGNLRYQSAHSISRYPGCAGKCEHYLCPIYWHYCCSLANWSC